MKSYVKAIKNLNDLDLVTWEALGTWLRIYRYHMSVKRFERGPAAKRIDDRKISRMANNLPCSYEKLEEILQSMFPNLEWGDASNLVEFHRHDSRELADSEHTPRKLSSNRWLYKETIYETDGPLTEEQFRLQIIDAFDSERKYWERLKSKHTNSNRENTSASRIRISESVRIEVWRRDGGKCARCGSRDKLEYDHIVPVSKGGSNTARNIELLCEICNRSKGAEIK